jgi:DNA-binding NtrC family response regulator
MSSTVVVVRSPEPASQVRQLLIKNCIDCDLLEWDPQNTESVLDQIRHLRMSAPILAIVPEGFPDTKASSILDCADDFVFWPARVEEIRLRLRLVSQDCDLVRSVQSRLSIEMGMAQLIGNAPAFLDAIRDLPLLAGTDAPILITGETGTGKDLCARAIHHLSGRNHGSFIPVDCGATPDHLFENELFGHARGAYTDAHSDQKGLTQMADGGTLFLDEIDALSLGTQAKILRFLQERAYKPLGADKFLRADVRLVAASNRDIEAHVSEKLFRSDLYFRLNVLRVHLPPLRRRPDDIPILAQHFVSALALKEKPKRLSEAVLRKLAWHDWPGNVRELYNVIHRAVIYSQDRQIQPQDIRFAVAAPATESPGKTFGLARAAAIEVFERRYVEEMLRKHGGNITRAARDAGKERRAFGRLVKKYR